MKKLIIGAILLFSVLSFSQETFETTVYNGIIVAQKHVKWTVSDSLISMEVLDENTKLIHKSMDLPLKTTIKHKFIIFDNGVIRVYSHKDDNQTIIAMKKPDDTWVVVIQKEGKEFTYY
jgi:hypothetical protein